MTSSTKESRIDRALKFLGFLETNGPSTLKAISEHLGCNQGCLTSVKKSLVQAGLVGPRHRYDKVYRTKKPYNNATLAEALGIMLPYVAVSTKCNSCKLPKTRILKDDVTSYTIYTDENNNLWKGLNCPVCVAEDEEEVDLDPLTDKLCRSCKKNRLPKSRYFDCYECVPAQKVVDDDFIYHTGYAVQELDDLVVNDGDLEFLTIRGVKSEEDQSSEDEQ